MSKFWVKVEGSMYKVAFAIQNQQYLWNEAVVTNIVTRVNFGLLFRQQNFSTRDMSHTFCRSAMKFGSIEGLANRNLFPNLVNFGPAVPWYHVATCINSSPMQLSSGFSTTSPRLPIVLGLFLFTALPED